MKVLKVLFTASLCTTALLGDYMVFQSKYSSLHAFRAVVDNAVHAFIGFFSSLLFFTVESREPIFANSQCVFNVILCVVTSSLIDVDHFILARSIHLKDVTGLKERGFLHCSTLWLFTTTILLLYCYINKKTYLYTSAWILIIAFTSHHIRDANRRGLWLYPFGDTPPLSKYLYIGLLAILPYVLGAIARYLKPEKPFDYSMII